MHPKKTRPIDLIVMEALAFFFFWCFPLYLILMGLIHLFFGVEVADSVYQAVWAFCWANGLGKHLAFSPDAKKSKS